MKRHPFKIDAMVVLPDHLHCIWTLPEGNHDFSKRWRLIKGTFSRLCTDQNKPAPDKSRVKKQEKAIWQRRFWEHLIRNEEDYMKHVEYTHYNPVKHRLVKAPIDWTYSSFHRYVRDGVYEKDWGTGSEIEFDDDIGKE
jgi:putative transposase